MEPTSSSSSSSSSPSSSCFSNKTACCSLFNFKKSDLVKSGFYRTKVFENIICCGCGWESGARKLSLKHLNIIHKLCNPDCEMTKNFNWGFKNYGQFKNSVNEMESVMRESFATYPKAYPDVEKMVQTGFYYTGIDDATVCVSCGVMLDQWNCNEDPMEEHKRASPFCELL